MTSDFDVREVGLDMQLSFLVAAPFHRIDGVRDGSSLVALFNGPTVEG